MQGPQGHHQTWMPGNIAPWVGTCLDALSHWASEMMSDYADRCQMGNIVQVLHMNKASFRRCCTAAAAWLPTRGLYYT